MNTFTLLEWLGTLCAVAGYILLYHQHKSAFWVWSVSNLAIIVAAVHSGMYGVVALQCFFLVMNCLFLFKP